MAAFCIAAGAEAPTCRHMLIEGWVLSEELFHTASQSLTAVTCLDGNLRLDICSGLSLGIVLKQSHPLPALQCE